MRSRSSAFNPNRCARCGVLRDMCICGEISALSTRTRVVVVVHYTETFKSSNTARLVEMALQNCEQRIRGAPEGRQDHSDIGGENCFVLFPSEDAQELNADWVAAHPEPVTLVVPDGSWRQAKKTARRERGIEHLPKLKLPPGPPSNYQLRSSPREDGVCTLEAVARALDILEGAEPRRHLEKVLKLMVSRNLWARGKMAGPRDQFSSGCLIT